MCLHFSVLGFGLLKRIVNRSRVFQLLFYIAVLLGSFFFDFKNKKIMIFDFIPFKLNSDIANYKGQIEYVSSEHGVELYKLRKAFIKPLLGFHITSVNLYFFEGNLVTVYLHLAAQSLNMNLIKESIESTLGIKGEAVLDSKIKGYKWSDVINILVLVDGSKELKLYLYFSSIHFSVFS